MNLVIDAGNTLTKLAFFENQDIKHFHKGPQIAWQELIPLLDKYRVKSVIISDVASHTDAIAAELQKRYPVLLMTSQTPCSLSIHYNSIETLGTDRLAAAVLGSSLFPGRNTLTIQAGTCITYEFVNQKGEYHGGSISPGIDMRFLAMHTFTAKLPLVKKEKINFLTGKTTKDSLLSGVVNGCIAETDGIIDQYKEKNNDLRVIMGGGDTFFFDKTLKNRIFAVRNLVLKGLNIILEHNYKC